MNPQTPHPLGTPLRVTTAWRVLSLRMEEEPPIWSLTANILNKQSRTAEKVWFSSLGVGRCANNSSPQKTYPVTNRLPKKKPRTWTDTLVRPKKRKRNMRFGTWNVRSLYRPGSITTAAKELSSYKLDLVGIQKVR